MAEGAKEVSIKLTAKDETAQAFQSVGQRMNSFLNSKAFEKLAAGAVIGGGAIAEAELIGKAADIATIYYTKLAEGLEHAGTEAQRTQAKQEALNEALIHGIPILGDMAERIEHAVDAYRDYRAVLLTEEGASEKEINAMRSRAGNLRYLIQTYGDQVAALNALADSRTRLVLAEDREGGATQEAIELHIKENESIAQLQAAQEKYDAYLRLHPNRTPAQQVTADALGQDITNIRQASLSEDQEIRDRFRKLRSEQDRDDARQHRDLTFRNAQDTADLEAQAYAQRLRTSHMEGEALLFELKHQHEKETQESKRAEDEAIIAAQQAAAKRSKERGDPLELQVGNEESRRIQREAEAKRRQSDDKFIADQAKLAQDVANSKQDEAEDRRHTVASMRLQLLKEEGAMGNDAAKQAAEILGIQEKYNVRRAEANRLLREAKDLTPAQRKELEEQIKANDKLQAAEEARMKMGVPAQPTNPFAQTSELGLGDTGMREAFAAGVQSNWDRLLELQQQMVDAILEQNDKIDQIDENVGIVTNEIYVK